jgi:adenine phosphoribosyltransferase
MPFKSLIRTIPDYPKAGIMFRDITTLLGDARGFRTAVNTLVNRYTGNGIDKVAGIEARGFILGAPLAHQLGVGFVPVRKQGKLPGDTIGHHYDLEYGTDTVEMHTDAIAKDERVLLVDDLIATGGTAEAAANLIAKSGGTIVECCFIVDLPDVGGRARLEELGHTVHALCEYEGD